MIPDLLHLRDSGVNDITTWHRYTYSYVGIHLETISI